MINDALRTIERYPLCDHCLGMMFARLGKGLGNKRRGEAIRRVLIMEIDEKYKKGEVDEEYVKRILSHLSSEETKEIAKNLGFEIQLKKCYICNNKWDDVIEKWVRKVLEALRDWEFKGFVIGCTSCGDMERRAEEVITTLKLSYAESVKSAIKRQVGKKVSEILGVQADFEDPDVVAILDFDTESVRLQVKPIYIYGRYWKVGRNISQAKWKYPFSIEEALENALKHFEGEDVIIHASGREDVDVRMLGTGRPFIAEVKRPRRRFVEFPKRYSEKDVILEFERFAKPSEIEELKMKDALKRKTYRAVVFSKEEITDEDLKSIEEFFRDTIVKQRTPRRVLHRRIDKVRKKKVYWVRTRKLNNHSFEAIINCDGGLYVKELVSGDYGRTEPSFSSVTQKEMRCVLLDVLGVEVD